MEFRTAEARDLSQIAAINIRCVPGGLRAAFGPELTAAFFRGYFEEGGPFIVAEENSRLAGFVMGSYCGSTARQHFETENAAQIEARLKEAAQAGNAAAARFFERKAAGRKKAPQPDALARYDATLLSLAVLPEFRGRGVAQQAIRACLDLLRREQKAKTCSLETQTDNFSAQHVFESCGYQEILRDASSVWYGIELF